MRVSEKLLEFNSLFDLLLALPDETTCRNFVEQAHWGGIPTCPHCECKEHYKLTTKGEFKGMYKCRSCKKRYTVTVGTIFESSTVPFRKWFIAIYIHSAHKKGVSSHQLARDIGVTQRTAWFMLHRIRHSMGLEQESEEQLQGTVEIDETFCGGKNRFRHADKKVEAAQGRSFKDKVPVIGIMQEAEKETIVRPHKTNPLLTVKEKIYHQPAVVRCKAIPDTKAENLLPVVRRYVKKDAIVVTDEHKGYYMLGFDYDHRIIDHTMKQYVDVEGNTTNAIEGFWTWIKRSTAIYHVISKRHLQAYVNENAFRFNTHRMKDNERFLLTLQCTRKRRLRYKDLVGR